MAKVKAVAKGAVKARPAHQLKQSVVDELAEKIKKAKTIAVVNLTQLPDKQFSLIKKKLRGKALFVVAKNTLIKRAVEKAKRGQELLTHVNAPTALVFTDMNPFELVGFVRKNKGKAAAKPGQIAPFDLIVPAGETSLPPGPVLSELKSAKIQAQIQGGKVVISKDSTVAKKGEKITDLAAKALQKLGIEPFEIGMNISAALEDGTVYKQDVLEIDEEKLLADFAQAHQNALNLSVEIGYVTAQNIEILIGKAVRSAKAVALDAKMDDKSAVDKTLAREEKKEDAPAAA
jgi:large subunit ribosomal protein L10